MLRSSVLVSSGQPIDDIFKYVESEDRLAMARDTLQWRHLAPTCPDTLCAYPLLFSVEHPSQLSSCLHFGRVLSILRHGSIYSPVQPSNICYWESTRVPDRCGARPTGRRQETEDAHFNASEVLKNRGDGNHSHWHSGGKEVRI